MARGMIPATIGLLVGLLPLGAAYGQRAVAPPPTTTVEIVSPHAPIYAAARQGAARRGTIALHTRLPLVARVPGTGCSTGMYVDLGERRFVCEELVVYSGEAPWGVEQPSVAEGESLPFRYAFIRYDATPAYARPDDYFLGDYVETYGDGFGLVVTGRRVVDGIGFLRLRRGTWISDDGVAFARGSDHEGVPIAPVGTLDVAWTRAASTRLYNRPHGRVVRRAGRRERVAVVAVDGEWARLADSRWVKTEDLNRALLSTPPDGIGEHERWIDVSVEEQVLVAYEGTTPVFATLVSTGADRVGSRTPIGTFHVWAKLASSDMDDLERMDVASNYLIEGVPWVQYFEGSNALHAAFWHDDFGHRRSHGCVNLSPRDARFLYAFTQPVVPLGFEAVIPFTDEPRTLVRIRP